MLTQFCTTKTTKSNTLKRKKRATSDTFNCNQLSLIPSTSYSDLALDPQPQVSIVASSLRPNRWVIQVKHADLTWDLTPSLHSAEALELLEIFQTARIDFSIDQNEGWPVDFFLLNLITEQFIDSGLVGVEA